MLRPLLGSIRPALCCAQPVKNYTDSVVKVGKDKYQVSMNVMKFNKDELKVAATNDYVVIRGQQCFMKDNGFVVQEFTRKFRLPPRCNPSHIKSSLLGGCLTITAKILPYQTKGTPYETNIPIVEKHKEILCPEKEPVDTGNKIACDDTKTKPDC